MLWSKLPLLNETMKTRLSDKLLASPARLEKCSLCQSEHSVFQARKCTFTAPANGLWFYESASIMVRLTLLSACAVRRSVAQLQRLYLFALH